MSEASNDEALNAPESTEVSQPIEGQGQTPDGGQAVAAVEQGIVVGNQSFPSVQALVEAYQNSQKGFTQTTQKHARDLEAYKATTDWLTGLKKDQARWDRFLKYVHGGEPQAQTQQPQAGQAQTPQAGDPRFDEFRQDIDGRLEAQNAQLEYLQFRHANPGVDDQMAARVIDKVDELLSKGKDRSMQEVYLQLMAEENLAKSFSAGQASAQKAQAASRAAGGVLGGTAPAAQAAQKPQPKFNDMKTVGEQNDYISRLLKQLKK